MTGAPGQSPIEARGFTTAGRWIQVENPLGPDVLLAEEVTAREALNDLFRVDVACLAEPPALLPHDLLGLTCSVGIGVGSTVVRWFHGMVSAFSAGPRHTQGLQRYSLTIVPSLWLATRTKNTRIFQDLTVPDVIRRVLAAYGGVKLDDGGLRGPHPKIEYCVQYKESDFDFVRRLAEEAGILFFFRHEKHQHTLVLAEGLEAFQPIADRLMRPRADPTFEDGILEWDRRWECQVARWSAGDYNFKIPTTRLLSAEDTMHRAVVPADAPAVFEQFHYPGRFDAPAEARAVARRRLEAIETWHEVATGASSQRALAPGTVFTFEPAADEAAAEGGAADEGSADGRGAEGPTDWALVEVAHHVAPSTTTAGGAPSVRYGNRFVAVPATARYRPRQVTPKPVADGPETAFVVGPRGEDVHADQFGRIKVRFHWDRAGTPDAEASCWIRVAQGWAGRGFGAFFLPRVGMEVVVDFIDGDPDRPIVVGCVHNAEAMPTYAQPGERARSGVRTRTLRSTRPTDVNEFRFDDTPGREHIYVHAQRDLLARVEAGERRQVGGALGVHVGADRRVRVGADDHLTVEGDLRLLVEDAVDATVGGGVQLTVDEGIGVRAGRTVSVAAPRIQLVAGGSFVRIGPDGVTIEGPTVRVNCGAAPPQVFVDPDLPRKPGGVEDTRVPQPGAAPLRPPPEPGPATPRRVAGPARRALVARQREVIRKGSEIGATFLKPCRPSE